MRRRRRFNLGYDWTWTVLSAVLALAMWQISVVVFQVPPYVLPKPTAVWAALVSGLTAPLASRASLWWQLEDTLAGTIYGFLIAAVIGIALAALMSEYRVLRRLLFPYVVWMQSLPKIAIAPLFVIWFGYAMQSKVAMATTITLFPVLLNSLEGFAMVEAERLQLMLALDANRWQTFWLVKLPSAMPFIFAGLNLGIVYALLGTLLAEFLGSQRGVGVVITQLESVSDTAGIFAVLVVLAVVSYLLIALMRALQRHFVFWSGSEQLPDMEVLSVRGRKRRQSA
jgi:NitT/TauT family transport system permease protein